MDYFIYSAFPENLWSIGKVPQAQSIISSSFHVKDRRTRREWIWAHSSILHLRISTEHFRLYMGNVFFSTAPTNLCDKGHGLPKETKIFTACQHLQEPALPRLCCLKQWRNTCWYPQKNPPSPASENGQHSGAYGSVHQIEFSPRRTENWGKKEISWQKSLC